MKIRLGKPAVNIFKAFQSNTRFFFHFYSSQIIRGFSRNIFLLPNTLSKFLQIYDVTTLEIIQPITFRECT